MINVHRRSAAIILIATTLGIALRVMPAAPARASQGLAGFFFLVTLKDGDEGLSDFFVEADSDGNYNVDATESVEDFLNNLKFTGKGDPFLEYTLTVTNTRTEPGTLFYGITIDIEPVRPADPNWLMRSTLDYSVEDTGGDGSAMLLPDAFGGLQQAVLSDDRTNVVSDSILFQGFDDLTVPGQASPSDTGPLPLLAVPPLPPGVTIDTYGVMGVRGAFELSAGDTAVINGRFEIASEMGETLPGDYNNDGVVNAADYTVWRDNKDTDGLLPNDPIGGIIGDDQYFQWRDNYGNTASATGDSTAVPEPASLVLLAMVMGIQLVTQAQRRRHSAAR